MSKRWILLSKKSNDLTEQLLINRKIKKEDWASFLKPDFRKGLYDPFLMKGMEKTVARTILAIKNKETVGIFGDYDADGIPGSVLLNQSLKKLGLKTEVFIPTREQGYGLNQKGIDILKKAGVSLLITVDLGVRNLAEVSYAKKNGMDVIILDHHEVGNKFPDCIIVDPKQVGDKYPFKELAATGVVFKLLQALSVKIDNINESFLKWSLDLVAISTICDVVPLLSENRIFAKYGLIVLKKTRNIGLLELYKKAAILPETINTYSVGFQIGPRINAPGRMDNANESFYLLSTRDKREANTLAQKLDKINLARQEELKRVLGEARKKVCDKGLDKKKVILVTGKKWPHGIIGLVAGKLMEEYARPVIVCEHRKKDLRGSARSIDAYNMIEALDEAKIFLTRYGGHTKAAGLTFEHNRLSNLYDKLLEVAESKLKDEDLIPKITIDAKINLDDVDYKFIQNIKQFEPFGLGNPRPVFMAEKVPISEIRTVGKENKHLKMKVGEIDAIGFDLGSEIKNLKEGQKINTVFTVDEDTWNGNSKIQLKILDLKIL